MNSGRSKGEEQINETSSPRMTAARLGSIGVWSGRLHRASIGEAKDSVLMWEELGYGAVWIPEPPAGRYVLSFAAVALGHTTSVLL